MIVSVFGLRDYKGKEYDNYDHIADVLDTFGEADCIVSGGGKGIEQLAVRYAREKGIEPRVIPPNINKFGNAAFVKRNQEIVRASDMVVIFWDCIDNFYVDLMKTVLSNGKHCYLSPIQ